MSKFKYNLSRAILSADDHNSPEWEDSFELQRTSADWKNKLGIASGGSAPGSCELSVLWSRLQTRDLTTASGGAGAFTVGQDVPEIQQSLRPTSLLMRLPIAVLDHCKGNITLPRISVGVVPSGLSEIQSFTTSDPTFGATAGGPQRLAVQVTFSKQLLTQAAGSESFDKFLIGELKSALGFQIDSWLLTGSGINGQPIGILNQPGLTANTYSGAVTWAKVLAVQQSLEAAYIDSTAATWLLGIATAAKWRQALRGTGTATFLLQDGKVGDIPAYPTTFVGATEQTILADFSKLTLAIFGDGIDLVVDRYTKAATAEIVITAQIFYQAFIRRPTVFCVSTDTGAT